LNNIARSRDPISRVEKHQSIRQGISNTYSAPLNYRSDGDDLGFDRNFGGTHDAVVLPAGWYLIESVISPSKAEASSVTTNGKGPPRCHESVIGVQVVERGARHLFEIQFLERITAGSEEEGNTK
jgi:hypothetical protein